METTYCTAFYDDILVPLLGRFCGHLPYVTRHIPSDPTRLLRTEKQKENKGEKELDQNARPLWNRHLISFGEDEDRGWTSAITMLSQWGVIPSYTRRLATA